jgi:hypothetical protein
VIDTFDLTDIEEYLERQAQMKQLADIYRPHIGRNGRVAWPISGGARQYLQDGPYIDPPVASGSALVSTSAEDLWVGSTFTPIFANDPKAGKIYTVEAGGIMSFAATGALTITPTYGGSAGVALGASQAQTTPGTTTAQPWYLRFNLVFRTIGAAGTNSTCIGTGFFTTAGATSAGSAVIINFGGTSASVDATINKDIHIRKTLSVAGSMTMQYAYIFSVN